MADGTRASAAGGVPRQSEGLGGAYGALWGAGGLVGGPCRGLEGYGALRGLEALWGIQGSG